MIGKIALFVICLNIDFSVSILDKITDSVSEIVSNVAVTKALTEIGTTVEDRTLSLVTGGDIQNASTYTKFLFFSRETGEDYIEITTGEVQNLLEAGFSTSRNTKILIPGWTSNGTDRFIEYIKQAILEKEDVNLFAVDWPDYAQKPYSVAYTAVPYVGAYVASFVDFLVDDVGTNISTIHLIGFSLGAHISGTAGEEITCGKLPRITGLDPAGPLFTSSAEGRLDPSDAEFVDVVHTTAGLLGYADPLGTVDFYPNGGYAPQAGCSVLAPWDSHGRAFEFYAESVSSEGLVGRQCDSWRKYTRGECAEEPSAIMGYNVDTSVSGVYYLETNADSPFAKWDSL